MTMQMPFNYDSFKAFRIIIEEILERKKKELE